jgi:Zn-finger nucleic acid-binding protein
LGAFLPDDDPSLLGNDPHPTRVLFVKHFVDQDFDTEIAMEDQRITDTGYDQEDAYSHQKDAEMLAKRRAALDAQRSGSTVGTINCPRCGSDMNEVAIEHVKVDRCAGCGGVFLDKGELEILTHAKSGGFFKRLFGA